MRNIYAKVIEELKSLRIDVDLECAYRDPEGFLMTKFERANEMLDEAIETVKSVFSGEKKYVYVLTYDDDSTDLNDCDFDELFWIFETEELARDFAVKTFGKFTKHPMVENVDYWIEKTEVRC